jgi:hypothetical protein
MYITTIGRVVRVNRNVGGGTLSYVRLAHDGAGQTVQDGKYGARETGFIDYSVWEDNTMAGSRFNFTKTIEALKPGTMVQVLAELVDRTTKEGTEVKSRGIHFNALRIDFINTSRPADGSTKVAAAGEASEAPEAAEQSEFAPDPFA